ncbi:contractile injection system tape measure protein [Pedobacter sandarakinus]|uniref:contractile injection system tape measure protein n=1 Tax=Pedobacter sandarakinus TaxID=353156 RepID=UPI002246F2A1|nr:contractile injection system tape measure protein [Pedobacter sandarakinus]MCX2574534.1 contractile injection system tape measure protein [Pedobacter sandarakinus]
MAKHVIHTQRMLLSLTHEQHWRQVQTKVSEFCQNELPGIFDKVFNDFSKEEDFRIDKLDLRLDDIDINHLLESLRYQVYNQLVIQLKAYRSASKQVDRKIIHHQLKDALEFSRYNNILEASTAATPKLLKQQSDLFDSLLYYCDFGMRPWWMPSEAEFKPTLLLLKLYDDRLQFTQLIRTAKEYHSTFRRFKNLITKALFFGRYFQFDLDDQFISYFISNIKQVSFNQIVDGWLHEETIGKEEIQSREFIAWLDTVIIKIPAITSEIQSIVHSFLSKLNHQSGAVLQFDSLYSMMNKISDVKSGIKIAGNEEIASKDLKQPYKKLEWSSLIVFNGGLVLFYPFLKQLFTRLSLLEGEYFKDTSSQHNAVLYLHYLVYSIVPEDESMLLLNKIICGLPPETVINFSAVSITQNEQEELNALKDALITQWTTLKSTSFEGVLAGFVRRNGVLSFKDGNWHLAIERKGVDVLLNSLPWSISIITFKWNKYLIQVGW